MITVLVFGTFDILHPGHIKFLTAARRLGDRLIVVVARDEKVRHEKYHLPIMNERERLELVAALKPVTRAFLGDRVGEWTAVRRLRPNVIAVGFDQKIPHDKKHSAVHSRVKIKRLPRFAPDQHSSSLIKRRITHV